jgi:hypothetical protein
MGAEPGPDTTLLATTLIVLAAAIFLALGTGIVLALAACGGGVAAAFTV